MSEEGEKRSGGRVKRVKPEKVKAPKPPKPLKPLRKFALKVAYLGMSYQGFEHHPHQGENSVEAKLFGALTYVRLIGSPDEIKDLDYHRCGRTDKGVSAAGNTVSLNLRVSDAEVPNLVKRINSALPEDIVVLSAVEVPQSFSAQFSCKTREYRYYFFESDLDLERMESACRLLEGEHDFRNFCKWNEKYEKCGTVRNIFTCRIVKDSRIFCETVSRNSMKMAYMQCIGSGFLWHQIRLIMNVLKAVARGEVEPEIISSMLADPRKEAFEFTNSMQDGESLVLYDTTFEDINWKLCEETDPEKILSAMLHRKLMELKVASSLMEYYSDRISKREVEPKEPFVHKFFNARTKKN